MWRLPFPFNYIVSFLVRLTFTSSEVGAYTSQFATSSSKVREAKAKYRGATLEPPNKFIDDKVVGPRVEELWALSENVMKDILEKGSVHNMNVNVQG